MPMKIVRERFSGSAPQEVPLNGGTLEGSCRVCGWSGSVSFEAGKKKEAKGNLGEIHIATGCNNRLEFTSWRD